jgi:hypothetical protein
MTDCDQPFPWQTVTFFGVEPEPSDLADTGVASVFAYQKVRV